MNIVDTLHTHFLAPSLSRLFASTCDCRDIGDNKLDHQKLVHSGGRYERCPTCQRVISKHFLPHHMDTHLDDEEERRRRKRERNAEVQVSTVFLLSVP